MKYFSDFLVLLCRVKTSSPRFKKGWDEGQSRKPTNQYYPSMLPPSAEIWL